MGEMTLYEWGFQGPLPSELGTCMTVRALASRLKSSKPIKLFPPQVRVHPELEDRHRAENACGWPLDLRVGLDRLFQPP
jgi:hypothetical protein